MTGHCNSTESCPVLFSDTCIDWFEARRRCIEAGGDLASVLSFDQLPIQFPDMSNNFVIIGGYRRPWWWISNESK